MVINISCIQVICKNMHPNKAYYLTSVSSLLFSIEFCINLSFLDSRKFEMILATVIYDNKKIPRYHLKFRQTDQQWI